MVGSVIHVFTVNTRVCSLHFPPSGKVWHITYKRLLIMGMWENYWVSRWVCSEVYLSTSPVTSKDRHGLVNILKNKPGWLVNISKRVSGAYSILLSTTREIMTAPCSGKLYDEARNAGRAMNMAGRIWCCCVYIACVIRIIW